MIGSGHDRQDDRDSDRDHHHRRCSIRYPHREKRGGDHEPENQAFRACPHNPDDMQSDPPVQVPPLHRHRDDEPAEEEEDHLVSIRFRHLHRGENPESREEDQREEGGRLQRDDA
ncbi:hypothetical protein DSECCO2_619000 [anaerobic digester metagenome]